MLSCNCISILVHTFNVDHFNFFSKINKYLSKYIFKELKKSNVFLDTMLELYVSFDFNSKFP